MLTNLNKLLIGLLLVSLIGNVAQWYINRPSEPIGTVEFIKGQQDMIDKQRKLASEKSQKNIIKRIADSISTAETENKLPIIIYKNSNEKNRILHLPADSIISDITNRLHPSISPHEASY